MSDSSIDFAKVRELVTLTPPRGMKARVLEAVLTERSRPSLRLPRTLSLAFVLLLVSATAAAIVGSPLAPWSHPTRWLQLFRPAAPPPAAPLPHRFQQPAPHPPTVSAPDSAPTSATASDSASDSDPAPDSDAPPPPAPASSSKLAPRATPPIPSAPPIDSTLAEEVAAYREAAALVSTSPGLAIVRLRAHRERFPTSALGQEVSLRLVQAFTALGRDADARREAQTFVTRYPESARRAEMEAIVGGAPLARPTE